MFEGHLVEVLLSALLAISSAAFGFLWRENQKLRNEIEKTDQRIDETERMIEDLWGRIFGREEDETMQGHLVETEERFDSIDRKLEDISQAIEKINEERIREHGKVQEKMDSVEGKVDEIIDRVSEEEALDIDLSDFDR